MSKSRLTDTSNIIEGLKEKPRTSSMKNQERTRMITHIMSNQDKYAAYNTKQWYLNTLSDRQLRGIIAGNKTQTLEAEEARKEKCRAYNRNYRLRKATRAPAKATQRN